MNKIFDYLLSKGFKREEVNGYIVLMKNGIIIKPQVSNVLKLNISVNNNCVFKGEIKSLNELKTLERQLGLVQEDTNRKLLIRKFEEETDLYVYGGYFDDVEPTISITDDEASIDLVIQNEEEKCINTNGFVYILTASEMRECASSIQVSGVGDYVFIENFKGTITLEIPDEYNARFIEGIDVSDCYITQCIEYNDNSQRAYVCPKIVFNKVDGCGYMYGINPTRVIEKLFLDNEDY